MDETMLVVDPVTQVVMYGNFAVGKFANGVVTLNLGWMRLAGLGLIVEDDPQQDRHRDGVVLRRVPGEG